jgi:DNA ligase (NAD+)
MFFRLTSSFSFLGSFHETRRCRSFEIHSNSSCKTRHKNLLLLENKCFATIRPSNSQQLPSKIEKRIKELRDLLSCDSHRYNQKYYNENISVVSDEKYDSLRQELAQLEEQYNAAALNSPTRTVGAPVRTAAVMHKKPMLSLNHTYDIEELKAFDERVQRVIGEPVTYVCELKYDGLAVSLHYKDGRLVRALKRGDGMKGEEVTENVRRYVDNVPFVIPDVVLRRSHMSGEFEVRGEVVMSRTEFARVNAEAQHQRRSELYSNPRNLAAGMIARKHKALSHIHGTLSFISYALLRNDTGDDSSQWNDLHKLRELGFTSDPHAKLCNSIDEVIQFAKNWAVQREAYPYATDGIVVKVNSRTQQRLLGDTSTAPRWAIAYKASKQQVEAQIADIVLQVGRTGKVTPVAVIDPPAEIDGVLVRSATLHNKDFVEQNGIRIGSRVRLERGGDVIPKIVAVVSSDTTAERPIDWSTCPCSLRVPLVQENTKDLFCRAPNCPHQQVNRIYHFVAKGAVHIPGLGKQTLNQLIELGLIRDISDIFTLKNHRDKLLQLSGWGEKKVANLLQNIEVMAQQATLEEVLTGLGIPRVGKELAALLANHFGHIDNLMTASLNDLLRVPGIGQASAHDIVSYFANPRTQKLIAHLKAAGLNFSSKSPLAPISVSEGQHPVTPKTKDSKASTSTATPLFPSSTPSPSLQTLSQYIGKTFVFTGRLKSINRKEATQLVHTCLHGQAKSSLTATTNYLVVGTVRGETDKQRKAQELGVPILTEQQFLDIIEQTKNMAANVTNTSATPASSSAPSDVKTTESPATKG